MILEYSYEKATKVLELFKESKIASLDITEGGDSTIMEYTLIDEYPVHMQRQIRNTLAGIMPRRLQLIEFLNNYIVTKSSGVDIKLELHFNAVSLKKAKIDYSYTGGPLLKSSELDNLQALKACLDRVDQLVIAMGVSSQELDVYKKDRSGRNKKYVPVTLRDFGFIFRKALEE